jgi:hypothetical protein
MLLRLCQLKSLILLLPIFFISTACSWRRDSGASSNELMTTFSNNWFAVKADHSLVNKNNEPLPHLLFDTTPEFKSQERTVNAIITTAEGSPHAYSIDMSSGQRHYSYSFCKQKDIWNSYSGKMNRPIFSIGYIPRVLDQLGEPQKIVVWSRRKSFIDIIGTNYHKVKLVGAYVEQICLEGNCIGKSNWLSRLVFVGLDAEDKSFDGITSIADFKKAFDWDQSKAYLENIEGRNFIGDANYPSIRVGQLIEHDDAFDYFKKRSIFLTDAELKKIQKGCHILYDELWNEVGKMRPEDKPAKTTQELVAKLKLQNELKNKRVPVGFAARFQKFTKKYYNEISTCEKFVYHGNVNRNREAFWFLSYVGLFYRLHREGYYFDCRSRAWQRNVIDNKGSPVYNIKEGIDECMEPQIDQAMGSLPNFLAALKGEKEYFRFVDYDNHSFGTHNKLYSWVKTKSRKFDCSDDPNSKIRKDLRIFPEDVEWEQKNIKDIATEIKIIY